ncbi:hypothetical protein [Bacillus phage DZ1]|uniref:Uncharacterized protein n=1 Tax=Bacillus phage DZ1 TaxID=3075862 RepID=A0AA96EQX0_9CAUD|nr:hypothetical protein [Bacillus phage DZ1]
MKKLDKYKLAAMIKVFEKMQRGQSSVLSFRETLTASEIKQMLIDMYHEEESK